MPVSSSPEDKIAREVLERELKRDKRRGTVLPLPEDRATYPTGFALKSERRGAVLKSDEDLEWPESDDEDTYEEFIAMCRCSVSAPRLAVGANDPCRWLNLVEQKKRRAHAFAAISLWERKPRGAFLGAEAGRRLPKQWKRGVFSFLFGSRGGLDWRQVNAHWYQPQHDQAHSPLDQYNWLKLRRTFRIEHNVVRLNVQQSDISDDVRAASLFREKALSGGTLAADGVGADAESARGVTGAIRGLRLRRVLMDGEY